MKITSHILVLALVPVFALGSPVKAGCSDRAEFTCQHKQAQCMRQEASTKEEKDARYARCNTEYDKCILECSPKIEGPE
jgi:hypothetical protein